MDANSQQPGNPQHPGGVNPPETPNPAMAGLSPHAQVLLPPQPQRRARWPWVLLALGLMGLMMFLLLIFGLVALVGMTSIDTERPVQERYHSYNRLGDDKVAIIHVDGTILSGEGFIKRQIDTAMNDDDVKAVVLRVDSPGGSVTGSDYIYHHLCKLRKEKPIVVSMGGMAASGGYYVSMAVGDTPDSIFAEPTTWTGSIGVIIPHYDLSGLLENWNVKEDSITSGPMKQMGSFTKAKTEEERAAEREVLQELVDLSFARFKDIIATGRPGLAAKDANGESDIDRLATGQIYSAEQALEKELIDEIGFIEKAIERVIVLADLDEENVMVVEYKRELGLAALFMKAQTESQPIDLAGILDLSSPRAYYLCTSLPLLTKTP